MNLLQRLWLLPLCERAALALVGNPTTLYCVSLAAIESCLRERTQKKAAFSHSLHGEVEVRRAIHVGVAPLV
jgi:hypothetical protein